MKQPGWDAPESLLPAEVAELQSTQPLYLWTHEDVARFLRKASAAGPDSLRLSYKEHQLWCRLDPYGLTTIINRLVMEGLPLEMKRAKAVYINRPGRTERSNPKSYRAMYLPTQHHRGNG